jgi:hypothetical protein
VDHPDSVPIENEVLAVKRRNKEMNRQIKMMKDANKVQKKGLTKLMDYTDFEGKIEQLLEEVADEKQRFRELNTRKLKELHKNYGQEEN